MKKIYCCLFVTLVLFSITGAAQAKKIENLSIIVPSCDKYAEVWHPFFTLLFKYWPNLEQPIYLISNTKVYTDPRVDNITIAKEKSWSDNLLLALEKTNDKYVMIISDDYFITRPVEYEKIQEYFEIMQKEKAACLQLVPMPNTRKHPDHANLAFLEKEAQYRCALQIAIWDKAALKQLLVSGENPWKFELGGTERSRALKRSFMCLQEYKPIHYFGAIWKGYWSASALTFLEKENIVVDRKLPVSGKIRTFVMGPLRDYASIYVAQPIKKWFGVENILPLDV